MSTAQRIDRLQTSVRELQIEYEKFFNGARAVPPVELQETIQGEIRWLRNANIRSVEENFRLGQIEARFNSFSELFGRRLRQVEEGRTPGVNVGERSRRSDPQQGVVVDDALDPSAVETLYHGLASGPGRGPKFDQDSFRGYLEKQVAAIRAKTGCSKVRFRLEPEGDRMKLKAKPIRD